MPRTYRALDPDKVIETIGLLQHRIAERFPGAGLGDVCAELLLLARASSARAQGIARSNMPLRIAIFAMVGISLTVLMGYSGQVSLGQWGLTGVGAFA